MMPARVAVSACSPASYPHADAQSLRAGGSSVERLRDAAIQVPEASLMSLPGYLN